MSIVLNLGKKPREKKRKWIDKKIKYINDKKNTKKNPQPQ